MEFNWRNRRYLTPRPIPVILGFYIYPLCALAIVAMVDRVWVLGVGFLTVALLLYFLFIEHRAVVLSDSILRYELYRKVDRYHIARVVVELNSSNATGLPLLHGYMILNDGREVAPDFLFSFVFRPPPWGKYRVMRQAKEIAVWAGVPFEVIENSIY